tara:strand:- start:1005 stop:1244 length:240 start_codon:yes stop_codon:yes gene_type:complete
LISLLFNFDLPFRRILRPFFPVPFRLGHIELGSIAAKELIDLVAAGQIIQLSYHLVKDSLDLSQFTYVTASSLDQTNFH